MGDFFQGFGAGFLALATTTVAAQVLHAAYQRRRELAALERDRRLQRAEAAVPARAWPPEDTDPLGLTEHQWTLDEIMRREG